MVFKKMNFTQKQRSSPLAGRCIFGHCKGGDASKASIRHLLTCTAPALFAASFDQNAINGLRFNFSSRTSNHTGRLLIVEIQV